MSATPDRTLADPQQIIADLQRQLSEYRAERDEALGERDMAQRRLAERTAERDEALVVHPASWMNFSGRSWFAGQCRLAEDLEPWPFASGLSAPKRPVN
jgi:hypothetical protein